MSDAGEDWTKLENFVRMLIDTGNASLEWVKIPDREPLRWAVDKLGKFCAEIEALEQIQTSPAHKQTARRSIVLGALAAAFEIGSHGTLSDNSKVAAAGAQAEKMREERGKQLQDDPERERTMRIMSKVVDGLLRQRVRRPGDEARPYKMARAMLPNVNQALEAKDLPPVNRDRIARYIKARPARS